jgi:hypothetical protein
MATVFFKPLQLRRCGIFGSERDENHQSTNSSSTDLNPLRFQRRDISYPSYFVPYVPFIHSRLLTRQRRSPYQPGAKPQERNVKHPEGLKARAINWCYGRLAKFKSNRAL